MAKSPASNIDLGDENQLHNEIVRLNDLKWSLMVDRKVRKANQISDKLFELERHIPSLPDEGLRLLQRLAQSPECELRFIAANHLIPLEPKAAKMMLADLAENASNVHIQITAWSLLEELNAGRIDYYKIMKLPPRKSAN
jgi:hypothetical protein